MLAGAVSASLVFSTRAAAAIPFIFNVNSTADEPDADISDSMCNTTGNVCTLRAAIMQANAIPNVDSTINVPAGTYTLGIPPNKGSLKLTSPGPTDGYPQIFVVGAGKGVTIIDGNLTDRVVRVYSGRTVTISGVSLVNGQVSGSSGGAIYNDGALSLTDVEIFNNQAQGDGGGIYNTNGSNNSLYLGRVTLRQNHTLNKGGAIANEGLLVLDHSIILDNTSAVNGGGIYIAGNATVSFTTVSGNTTSAGGGISMLGGTLTLEDSTLDANHAPSGYGGALYLSGAAATAYLRRDTLSRNTADAGGAIFNVNGQLFMSNVTVSENQAVQNGGGLYNNGAVNVYSSTIAYNEADSDADSVGDGGGVFNVNGRNFNVANSLLIGNYLAGAQNYHDCFGLLGIYGNDKFSGTQGCAPAAGSTGTAALIGSVYELGILQDNGGPTQTIAIVPSSNDLIGHGLLCADWTGQPIGTDQRGRPRPPAVTERCDIGAFEYNELFANGFE